MSARWSRTGGEVHDSEGQSSQARRPHRACRQCCLRRLPFLPQRLSLLHVREPRGLWQQPALRPGPPSLRRLVRAHVPAPGHAALPSSGRPAGSRCGADGDHVGDPWRRDGAWRSAFIGGSRFGPLHRCPRRRPAGALPSDQGKAPRRRPAHRHRSLPVPPRAGRGLRRQPHHAGERRPTWRSA